MFILTGFTAEAFALSVSVFRHKKYDRRESVVLELVPLRVTKKLSHAHKTRSWYILGVLVKISHEQHPSFIYGSSPGAIYAGDK